MNEIIFDGACWMKGRFDFPVLALHVGNKVPGQPWGSKGLTTEAEFRNLINRISDPETALILVIPQFFGPFFIPRITNYNKLTISMLRGSMPMAQVDLHTPNVTFTRSNAANYPDLPNGRLNELMGKFGIGSLSNTFQVGIWTDWDHIVFG